jgi:hypothetical protein
VISPAVPWARKVFANSVSPPRTLRVTAPRSPPFMVVSRDRLALMLTMAPASAWIASFGSSFTIARE